MKPRWSASGTCASHGCTTSSAMAMRNSGFPLVKWGFRWKTSETIAARETVLHPTLLPTHLGALGRGSGSYAGALPAPRGRLHRWSLRRHLGWPVSPTPYWWRSNCLCCQSAGAELRLDTHRCSSSKWHWSHRSWRGQRCSWKAPNSQGLSSETGPSEW